MLIVTVTDPSVSSTESPTVGTDTTTDDAPGANVACLAPRSPESTKPPDWVTV